MEQSDVYMEQSEAYEKFIKGFKDRKKASLAKAFTCPKSSLEERQQAHREALVKQSNEVTLLIKSMQSKQNEDTAMESKEKRSEVYHQVEGDYQRTIDNVRKLREIREENETVLYTYDADLPNLLSKKAKKIMRKIECVRSALEKLNTKLYKLNPHSNENEEEIYRTLEEQKFLYFALKQVAEYEGRVFDASKKHPFALQGAHPSDQDIQCFEYTAEAFEKAKDKK